MLFQHFKIQIEIFCVILVVYVLPEFVTLLFNMIQYGTVFRVYCFPLKLKLDGNWQNWTEVFGVIDLAALIISRDFEWF